METLKDVIEFCLIPKLCKNYEESSNHPEFEIRNKRLEKCFNQLLKKLETIFLKDYINSEYNIVSHLLILYYELSTNAIWNNKKCLKLSEKLKYYFEVFYETNIINVLRENKVFHHQEILDKCLEYLHNKLTATDFKRYPGQIEVYFTIIKDIKNYNVIIVPSTILPAALYLIDDYVPENKIKGLKCSLSILHCLKDKLDEIYDSVLDQLVIESNLYRKAEYLNFTRTIISIHKIHCVNRSIFLTIIADNLDLCCNETVGDVLLDNILLTLKEWIRYCWCVWKLTEGQKVLSNLFKILYCCKGDQVTDVHGLIVTLIKLCNEHERKNIINNLDAIGCSMDKTFTNRMSAIKSDIT
ncbi:uncharacterized protein [Battus philenor]|uniref:uncharacterized protein isoform X2 n=1 Tax=Battus philenor TaxID=42288 RepID=UPI0035CEAE86